MESETPWVHRLLNENSSSNYYIEFGGFLSNHLAHGIIALQQLGASEERVKQFINYYVTRLEPPVGKSSVESSSKTDFEKAENVLGKRVSYEPLVKYYKDLLHSKYSGNQSQFISEEFPHLRLGMVGSAFHGLIHTGYAFSVRNSTLLCEGMAYLHHSYQPLVLNKEKNIDLQSFGTGKVDIFQVVNQIREDKRLHEIMSWAAGDPGQLDPRNTSSFQLASSLITFGGDELVRYVHLIQFPDFFDPKTSSMEQIHKLMKWLIDVALNVFVLSEVRNEFFLLHGATAAWSLSQLLKATSNYKEAMEAIRVYLAILLATYLAEGAPAINLSLDTEIKVDNTFWDQAKTEAFGQVLDEHIYKLIQVAEYQWKNDESKNSSILYGNAVRVALDHEITFKELKQ